MYHDKQCILVCAISDSLFDSYKMHMQASQLMKVEIKSIYLFRLKIYWKNENINYLFH